MSECACTRPYRCRVLAGERLERPKDADKSFSPTDFKQLLIRNIIKMPRYI